MLGPLFDTKRWQLGYVIHASSKNGYADISYVVSWGCLGDESYDEREQVPCSSFR
jgi:hypothetical protein